MGGGDDLIEKGSGGKKKVTKSKDKDKTGGTSKKLKTSDKVVLAATQSPNVTSTGTPTLGAETVARREADSRMRLAFSGARTPTLVNPTGQDGTRTKAINARSYLGGI